MKKFLFLCIFSLTSICLYAQFADETTSNTEEIDFVFQKKGRILLETGFNILGGPVLAGTGATSFSNNNQTISSLGLDGGYLVTENLALKLNLSIIDIDQGDNINTIGVGAKYYIVGRVPIELGVARISLGNDQTQDFTRFSIGYGIKLADNIYLEPSVGAISVEDESIGTFRWSFVMFL